MSFDERASAQQWITFRSDCLHWNNTLTLARNATFSFSIFAVCRENSIRMKQLYVSHFGPLSSGCSELMRSSLCQLGFGRTGFATTVLPPCLITLSILPDNRIRFDWKCAFLKVWNRCYRCQIRHAMPMLSFESIEKSIARDQKCQRTKKIFQFKNTKKWLIIIKFLGHIRIQKN